jgi:rhodanese-related sulfurtransferase
MNRRAFHVLLGFILVLGFVSSAISDAPVPKNEKKRTTLGKYVTSAEAYERWKANPDKVKIVDVRTPQEYVFVGHAPMAPNIPAKLWTGEWDPKKKRFTLSDNLDFEVQAKAQFKTSDTLMIMCRSGGRSAQAVNRLAKEGYTEVYNIIDGFEGDKVKDEQSYFNGKRMMNGWKNSGAPWTYALDPDLVYQPGE